MACVVLYLHIGVLLLFRMPWSSPEVLSGALVQKDCLMAKTRVLDMLHAGMSYNAIGLEVNVSESTMYIGGVSLSRKTY